MTDTSPTSNKRNLEDDDGCSTSLNPPKKCAAYNEKFEDAHDTARLTSNTEANKTIAVMVNVKDSSYSLRETDVGITEYISSLDGFSAILKERYSDFLVNEIDLDGNVLRLTNMDVPKEETVTGEDIACLTTEQMKLIEDLCSNISSKPVYIDVTDKDKDSRRVVHEAIRKNFHGVESTTEMKESLKYIVVKKGESQRRKFYPPNRGSYTHFILYKENKDTMDAVRTVGSMLRLPHKFLSYAGTKDKRAKTVQMVAAYKVDARNLLALNKKLNYIKIGNIMYKNKELKLGDLSGNNFIIVLRQVQGDMNSIEKAMSSLSKKGFINYYGMQRFGTTSVPTHHIGRALLQGKWKEAINLILQPRDGAEDKNLAEVRKLWHETQDAKKALSILLHKDCIEGKLLEGLSLHKQNDLVNALNTIPRNVRLMYIHSYQSYIWNKVVSKRIQQHGLDVQPGDIILQGEKDKKQIDDTLKFPVKFVTSEDIANGITPYDVVLPLPGHDILYPENETKEIYQEFLKEDGMDFNSFKSKVKSYSLSGSYRKILIIPTDVKWDVISYRDVCEPLVLSDFETYSGLSIPVQNDGPYKALKMQFQLPPSSYATMAIREVLKIDTCSAVQKSLSCKS